MIFVKIISFEEKVYLVNIEQIQQIQPFADGTGYNLFLIGGDNSDPIKAFGPVEDLLKSLEKAGVQLVLR